MRSNLVLGVVILFIVVLAVIGEVALVKYILPEYLETASIGVITLFNALAGYCIARNLT